MQSTIPNEIKYGLRHRSERGTYVAVGMLLTRIETDDLQHSVGDQQPRLVEQLILTIVISILYPLRCALLKVMYLIQIDVRLYPLLSNCLVQCCQPRFDFDIFKIL